MTDREKIDYDRACKNFLEKDMQAVIEKVISGVVPQSVASNVLDNLNQETAKDILKALDNDDVKKALKGDASDEISKNLGGLGRLSDSEIKQVVDTVKNAPPQFRPAVMEAVRSTVKLDDPESRSALLRTIGKAKSKEDLEEITGFANTIHAADPEEQKVFAEAFEKSPNIEARKALHKAASEIVQIDSSDPVRGKMVGLVKKVSELPADEQKNAYLKFADVAKTYRTTNDPELKKAMADAIMSASGPKDIINLGSRLDAISTAGKAKEINKDDQLAVISGNDPETTRKITAAGELVKSGDIKSAIRALDGKLSGGEMDIAVKQAENRKNNPFVPAGNDTTGNPNMDIEEPSVPKLEQAAKEEQSLRQKRKNAEIKISEYMRAGIEPGDYKLVEIYKEIAETDKEIGIVSEKVKNMRVLLRKKLSDLRERAKAEFAEAGIAFPEMDIKIPENVVRNQAPDERFTNLPEHKEFWSTGGGSTKNSNSKYFKFNTGGLGGVGSGDSILGKVTKNLGPRETWYSDGFSSGIGGSPNATREFEMSRTLQIAGILKRIPKECIASSRAGETTLMFEFIESVANRKTGQIEIPTGSVAICKGKDFDNDTTRFYGTCSTVDVGGRTDIRVNFVLGDANGSDGIPGKIIDERGWQLAAVFLTAFSASVLDGVNAQFVSPYEVKASKAATDYLIGGAAGGGSAILQDVAAKQIENWSKANTFWCSYDGALATVRQANQ